MKRYKALLRDTWPVWAVFLAVGCVGGFFLPVFFVAIPISVISFVYFGIMRYDKNGQLISEDRH